MDRNGFEFLRLTPEQVDPIKNQIFKIYQEAFALPPYSRNEFDFSNFASTFNRHKERRGFRCAVAQMGGGGPVVGFTYGYTSAPGQWWHDLVEVSLDPAAAREWLTDTFELVELAVVPSAQGWGAGSRLHDLLLEGLSHRSAVLSTMQVETVALKLYRKRGWVTLLENFIFPGTPKPYLIMGLRMKTNLAS